HVALLLRMPGDDRRPAGDPANHLEHFVHGHARAASNIVYTPRHAPLSRQDVRLDRIRHEREIAGLLAGAVHTYRLAPQCRAQEPVETHVRALTGSVDCEIA